MKKNTHIKYSAFLIAFLSVISFGFGQIVAWEFNGNTGDEVTVNATTLDANLNMSTLSRGSGIDPSTLVNSFSSNDFTTNGSQTDAIANNDFLEFQISASVGYKVSMSTLDANFRRSASTGPISYIWKYSTDGINFTDIGSTIAFASTATNGIAQTQIDLSGISPLQNVDYGTTITLRLFGWGATGLAGSFAFGRLTGDDLSIGGTVSALPPCGTETATWDGTNWVWDGGTPLNTVPTIATTSKVIIDGDYNTTTNGGGFSACSLTINSSNTVPEYTLEIGNGDYIEVQNDVTVNGRLFVNTQGNFIQNNDVANFNDNSINGVQVTKSKTMQNEYSYTYWSSPVDAETIENVFGNTIASRRYSFNANNFIDLQEEVGNTGVFLNNPGVDDIDDNGDDWQVTSTGDMQPGIGYAMTPSEFGPAFPRTEDFVFRGAFNNGIIQVPLVNNSGGFYNDWNFIGNPYPSAINTDQFFTVNTGIVGVIYLWDQATPASNTSAGSQGYNFSNDDYAMINGSGGIGARGNTGSIPNGSIASGQGFFVEALVAAPVTFNNSMRANGSIDNSQFFKNSNSKKSSTAIADKLWINLTSDNGIFNQILVAYVDGATSYNDGDFYDAKRIPSAGNNATLYSTIESDNGNFAIQGKNVNALDIDETISLGFKTTINVATLYKLSIAQLQGDFLTTNPVYLKDNLLNTVHDLSASDYTFTSEVGEFNSRFQIVFSANALSTDDAILDSKALSIVDLGNDRVQFNVTDNLSIKTVTIYDLLGRPLYNLKGNSPSETYNLSNLNDAIYIAKVELSNGAIITKKAVKR